MDRRNNQRDRRGRLALGRLARGRLARANLREANLREADLREAIGNLREVQSMHTDRWVVVVADGIMSIGCQRHTLEEWWAFDDSTIARMDTNAMHGLVAQMETDPDADMATWRKEMSEHEKNWQKVGKRSEKRCIILNVLFIAALAGMELFLRYCV